MIKRKESEKERDCRFILCCKIGRLKENFILCILTLLMMSKFHSYFRMNKGTFEKILFKIEDVRSRSALAPVKISFEGTVTGANRSESRAREPV